MRLPTGHSVPLTDGERVYNFPIEGKKKLNFNTEKVETTKTERERVYLLAPMSTFCQISGVDLDLLLEVFLSSFLLLFFFFISRSLVP